MEYACMSRVRAKARAHTQTHTCTHSTHLFGPSLLDAGRVHDRPAPIHDLEMPKQGIARFGHGGRVRAHWVPCKQDRAVVKDTLCLRRLGLESRARPCAEHGRAQ
eukprot:2607112-Alexandrium_andersonii.AAC.1